MQALFYATEVKKYDIVRILIANNANAELKDVRGMTAYDIALTKDYKELAAILNTKDEEEVPVYGTSQILSWRDMFSYLRRVDKKNVDLDIITLLFGMGMEKYAHLFCGMSLKTFLKLSEQDLVDVGIDIKIHRLRFVDDLFRFHNQKWTVCSLGYDKNARSYT